MTKICGAAAERPEGVDIGLEHRDDRCRAWLAQGWGGADNEDAPPIAEAGVPEPYPSCDKRSMIETFLSKLFA